MTDKPTGGPANAVYDENGNYINGGGLSIRDYFAAKAMQGMLADLPPSLYGTDWQAKLVSSSYKVADAMLEEREK